MVFKKYWDVFLKRLGRIEDVLILALENQKRLINILSSRETNPSERKKTKRLSFKTFLTIELIIVLGIIILVFLFQYIF